MNNKPSGLDVNSWEQKGNSPAFGKRLCRHRKEEESYFSPNKDPAPRPEWITTLTTHQQKAPMSEVWQNCVWMQVALPVPRPTAREAPFQGKASSRQNKEQLHLKLKACSEGWPATKLGRLLDSQRGNNCRLHEDEHSVQLVFFVWVFRVSFSCEIASRQGLQIWNIFWVKYLLQWFVFSPGLHFRKANPSPLMLQSAEMAGSQHRWPSLLALHHLCLLPLQGFPAIIKRRFPPTAQTL